MRVAANDPMKSEMKTRFWTKSGSEYLIDHDDRVWHREDNPASPLVRTANGVFIRISEIQEGDSVFLLCPPIVKGAVARIIRTTAVQRIEHFD